MTAIMAAKPVGVHFPTSEETMSALAQTVQSTYSKLELDTKRSVAHRRLEDSMQLRLGKITEKNASRPASSLSVNVNALHMSHGKAKRTTSSWIVSVNNDGHHGSKTCRSPLSNVGGDDECSGTDSAKHLFKT
mmetsp:Transcript_105659/g.187891  ORF Transcript_105659/g.187891 Transcript_105659/m.187891 type:complete len:133 (+) Transcript_105659:70-468(+)